MRERTYEKQSYPFFWLDEIVEVTLNPAKTNLKNLSQELLNAICLRLPDELARVTACMKTQAFYLYCGDHIRVVAGHYDQSLRLLQQQAATNLDNYPRKGLLRQTGELILNGLSELSRCLYKRYPTYLPPPETSAGSQHAEKSGFLSKVLCALSADQLGILLRAAGDAGILIGRSFRKVCKAFAPFLSTPWKTEIKPDTLRSHGSRPELHDKEVAIAFLEKMIEKIKGYR